VLQGKASHKWRSACPERAVRCIDVSCVVCLDILPRLVCCSLLVRRHCRVHSNARVAAPRCNLFCCCLCCCCCRPRFITPSELACSGRICRHNAQLCRAAAAPMAEARNCSCAQLCRCILLIIRSQRSASNIPCCICSIQHAEACMAEAVAHTTTSSEHSGQFTSTGIRASKTQTGCRGKGCVSRDSIEETSAEVPSCISRASIGKTKIEALMARAIHCCTCICRVHLSLLLTICVHRSGSSSRSSHPTK